MRYAILFTFQFPSNGKEDPNFKRTILKGLDANVFQFPSNGKEDPNEEKYNALCNSFHVSIPFKRERGS